MTKEIKFRAWDTSDKEKGPYMLGPYDLTDSIFNHKELRTLKLMQYTGLKDKNGVEIYEGDILKSESEYLEVEYCVQNSSFILSTRRLFSNHKVNDVRYSFGENLGNGYYSRKDLEIIGNIHQNPELL